MALLGVDDPEHNTQRRMLIPSFSVKRIAALRPRIQETVDGLLDAMERQGPPSELVADFALPVPSMVICALSAFRTPTTSSSRAARGGSCAVRARPTWTRPGSSWRTIWAP